MVDYGSELFKGTASYYSRYRPLYPSSLIRYLVNKFALDNNGQLLDLGCGTGQLALRLSDWFEEIVGVDTEQEMLDEAIRLSKDNRISNVKWLHGRAEELSSDWGTFRLTIIAKAFHWMDRESILKILYNSSDTNGGIAIIDNYSEKQEPLLWQQKVNEVVKRWLGDERRAGNSTFIPPKERYEDTVAKSGFKNVENHIFPAYTHVWTVETIIGYLYSTSFASKRFFGDNAVQFEYELKSALLDIDSTGVFTEEFRVQVITAFK